MDLKYILKICFWLFVILSLILFANAVGLDMNAEDRPKKLLQVITVEGLTPNCDDTLIMNASDAFCETHLGSSGTLDESCGKLTYNNCNMTSCCNWTSNKKCVAGGAGGPTFNTNADGKTDMLDYYYFQNKCYGAKCPKVE
jgi:hypothetical protein